MDCNKEEASRAKTLAEDKMKNGDFVGAQKLLLKAQSLFSGLETLPQMLAVCDVHNSAEKKLNGLENWYGILQVMHFADDATIKKQVRKLALLLHPDKNQFPGAESAFKLVWDASRFLADKDKRSQYDIKRRIYLRVASYQLNAANSGLQCASDSVTFWTCCEHCGYRYRYLIEYANTLLQCISCQRSYMAYDTGFNGASFKSSTGQKDVRNQGPCNTSVNINAESTGAQPGSVAAEVDKKGTFNEEFNKKNGGGEIKKTHVKKPKRKADSMKSYGESSIPEKDEGKMNSAAKLQKPQPEATEPEIGVSKSVPDESISRSDQAPSTSMDRNKRKKCVEESINVDGSDIVKDKADSKDNSKWKSQRRCQQSSSAAKVGSDDSPPKKRSRSNVGLKSEQTTRKGLVGVGSSTRLDSGGGSTAPSCVINGKAKKFVDSGYQEISASKDKEREGCKESGEGVVMAAKIDNNHNANEKLITQDSPDPEFNNFELTTSCFAVNQVWSLYDPTDGMPRLYARIEKVLDSEFKLWITWIDPLQDNNSIPIACGIFQVGDSDEENDHLKFSSQMFHITRNNSIGIYPRKGEIWAIFRGWDISWSASSENHKHPYEYDFVEVLSNFNDEIGLGVAFLGKVEGFVSLFRQDAQDGVLQLLIPPGEMLRFSHKVPSFKMTGKEREGVPPGCFELDTAALPKELFEVYNSKVDVGLDRERPNGKAGGPFPEASKVEMQANTTLDSSPVKKKRPKVHDSHGSFSKESDGRFTNHEKNSVKKSRKSVKAVDVLNLRKSPRLLSETNSQATSRSGRQIAEKKSANNGESCGQPGGLSLSGQGMSTPKISEKTITTDSSRMRKTPQDIHKPTGNLKKYGRNDESLSQSSGNGLLTQLNGSIKWSEPETRVPSSCKTEKENTFNFENQRSWDKFQIDQIWAIYSNDEGIPRKYAQIKKIDTSPEFKLHVAPLELYRPPIHMPHPVCCGRFKLKTGKAEVLVPSSFSHQVKAVKAKKNRFEVYPGMGEIWALYKNWNTTDCAETEELEIVEVVETDEQRIQAMPLTAKEFNNKPLYERSRESNECFVDIPKTEVCRFSHQIPAFRHERRATRFGDGEYWELDLKAVRGLNLKNP
ncbi:hypothetical protein ISN44_As11g027310 [Arabidopsis suecica]|uniref:J domain-containing protein n=1 Tax=Arabidopsis suecica TaxID=45249 RepID=A0A8T1ZEK6_ARASU|nr:hypothetical protein ISN44_As11g027310 [Arabidopsis suecica]KAG7556737.1 hypothetical protein ISN44_As11g027310 [Arabidopsis suecica]